MQPGVLGSLVFGLILLLTSAALLSLLHLDFPLDAPPVRVLALALIIGAVGLLVMVTAGLGRCIVDGEEA